MHLKFKTMLQKVKIVKLIFLVAAIKKDISIVFRSKYIACPVMSNLCQ